MHHARTQCESNASNGAKAQLGTCHDALMTFGTLEASKLCGSVEEGTAKASKRVIPS